MRWLIRAFLIFAFIGLACLAALPYLPNLKHEAQHFYQAWQQIRQNDTPESSASIELTATEPELNRTRNLVTPEQLQSEEAVSEKAKDPFLAEARQRASEDPEAAMQWLQSQHSGSERLRGMLEVVALWATEDSESAMLWLESNAQGLARLETLNNGVELWAERNPTAAAEWIEGMANDGSKITAAKSLAATWVQTQPEQATAWIAGLPAGEIRDEAAAALAEAWAQQDPQAASVWALAEAEFNGNTQLLRTTIQAYSRESPQKAEAFLRDISQATDAPALIATHVLARAEVDPAATVEWLTQLSPSDPLYSSRYANDLMQIWAENDSIAASEWLSQQPPGAQRDAAVDGFSESIQRFEPAAAAAWANTISDPDRRVVRLTESVHNWARTQPAEALEWVQTAELEPAVREHLAGSISQN